MTPPTFTKNAGDTRRFTFDFSERLLSGEDVATVDSFSIAKERAAAGADYEGAVPVTIDGVAISGKSVQGQFSSGQPGVLYLISLAVTGTLGTVVTATGEASAHLFIGPWDYQDGEAFTPENGVPPHNHVLADVTDAEPRLVPDYESVVDGVFLTLVGGVLAWVAVTPGGGISPPPDDGKIYGMLDGAWVDITGTLLPSGNEGDILLYTGGAWTATDTLPL